MLKLVSVSALTALMSAASFAASVQAQDLELRVGPDGVRPVIRDNRAPAYRERGCSEREARAAARESGLRDPEVVRVTDRRVVVQGFSRRGQERITFANEPGCPEI
ncbi:hypothetical protein [Rhizobium oryzicola]|uniref:Antifreeze protein n=1 Tax=Rhizobium oryzicola TaxID=1232668 RepID=A0ABT8SUJ2_9HYPH|nr:hypothetical protein [Rhizobium oryzicola]MDO1582087.1 hypothetical protein [Rhizobium oryzicola]